MGVRTSELVYRKMTPRDLACEIAGYLQENHNASNENIGYSNISANFNVVLIDGSKFDICVVLIDDDEDS